MMFSYFTYAAAFATGSDGSGSIEPRLVAVGLAIAPFVFIVLAFVSQNPLAPRDVLRSMGLLIVVGLSFGLLDPLAGAAAGFAAGGAGALNRIAIDALVRWRVAAVVFSAVYCLVLLIVITPAGVFAGAVTPLLMIGFADEYATWSETAREARAAAVSE